MNSVREFSPSERIYAVYAAYGKSMMAAHGLEKFLAALMIIHATEATQPGATRSREIAKIDRMTLGPLIAEFSSAYSPSEEVMEELSNMLYFRNELTHRISDSILWATSEHEWEDRVIGKLSEWTFMFRETKELLESYSAEWFRRQDINQQQLLARALVFHPGIQHEA